MQIVQEQRQRQQAKQHHVKGALTNSYVLLPLKVLTQVWIVSPMARHLWK
jgi:hypothetical protein